MSRPSRIVEPGLVALAARRTASWSVCALTLVVLGLSIANRVRPDATAVEAGLARQGTWFVFALIVAPLVVLRAASGAAPWRRAVDDASRANGKLSVDDAAWLAPRAVSNASIAVSTWAGAWFAGLALLVACAAVAEWRAGSTAPEARRVGSIAGPSARWVTSTTPLTWTANVGDDVAGARARIELGLGAGAGGAGTVELTARTPSSASVASARIGNRGWIEVALPPNERVIEFELACGGATRVCVLSDEVEVWRDASRTAAALALSSRFAIAMAAWIALAMAAACWMHPVTAAASVLAMLAPAWFANDSTNAGLARWIPGADVFAALEVVGDGRAPAAFVATELVGALVVVAASWIVARVGLRAWRPAR